MKENTIDPLCLNKKLSDICREAFKARLNTDGWRMSTRTTDETGESR